MEGKKTFWLAALAFVVALTVPAAGQAWHGTDDGSGAPNYDPPLYYPRTTYWVPLLHRCFGNHRAKTVSVYPANGHPDIEASFIIIKTPTSLIPRPYHTRDETGAGTAAPANERPEAVPEKIAGPSGQ